MAPVPLAERLVHILEASGHLERLWGGKDVSQFISDPVLLAASERFLERICEATKYIPEKEKSAHASIPWDQIRGLGNRLRHGYETIEPILLWDIIQNDIPALKHTIETILSQSPDDKDRASDP